MTLHSRRTVLRALAATPLVAACSAQGAPTGATTVEVWSWLTGMDRYAEAFNAAQREVFVEFRALEAGLSGGYARQANAIRARNAPDVLHLEYRALPQLLATGGLRDLTADLADLGPAYPPAVWRDVRPDGRTRAVPVDLAPMVFYHREDLFDRHGIPVPRTWAEFGDAARAVRAADREARITTFPLGDGSFFAGVCRQAGDPWWTREGDAWRVDVDGGGTLRTAAHWQALIDDDLVATVDHGTGDWRAALRDGRLWGLLDGPAGADALDPADARRWAVTAMPTWDGVPAAGDRGGSAFAVSAASRVPDAAVRFLRWLATDPAVPRLGAAVTTPFPAHPDSRRVAREAYRGDHFVGEPVYDVLDEAARRVPDWTWGPNALRLFADLADRFAGVRPGTTTLVEAVRRAQVDAVADLRSRGLVVREGAA
ncbi:ABC transporter substrate-binding protein [Saccharothrix syringae]|uniref:Extracellular solute-binding protein n=1 Tax=Saccharothrix syringae TaxID=103733 RepID=A0A5Q0GXK0_SACSY|nr:extracellular solute-binding protein [Saccharothrix syringae]QFZ18210.1 extracellular solute-binding protein [Saccharothrix syringae]